MKNILCIVTLLASFVAFGQISVSGTISDSDGIPLDDVNVTIEESGESAMTDLDGNYNIPTTATGEVTVKAEFGLSEQTMTGDVSGGAIVLDFIFESDDQVSLDGMVATATNIVRSQKETPMSLTAFKSEEIAKYNTSSQADILRNVPGITAEGGGGEVASNIFVRGLPSGGQYAFNPLQIDGMPVLSTFGLNSSAHDVYFRNDIGFESLEFVRGGASILYGVGSVAGIINYTSVEGKNKPVNKIRLETATNSRYKADFLSAGRLGGEDSNTYYALSGFYRYDQGPLKTGLDTEGFQLRGNIRKEFENSTFTISGQYIDDKVQFFLPIPLQGGSRERLKGNNGNKVYTLQTDAASDLTFLTPDGVYDSPIEDGAKTNGGYFMTRFEHDFSSDLKLDAKLRYSKYKNDFNLFLDGTGFNDISGTAISVETQDEYLANRGLDPSTTFTYLNGEALNSNALLFENRILDRYRPLTELVGDIKLTKEIGANNITFGTFLSRSDAGDFNVITRYLSEFNNSPELVNASNHTVNGISGAGIGYTNRNIESNKIAFFLADEIKLDRWNIDFGLRYERASGKIENEGKQSYTVNNTGVADYDNVEWGNGAYTRGEVDADGLAVAVAALYKISNDLSVYGNFSKGYFFPELRSVSFNALGEPSSYKSEKIYQFEAGAKYGRKKLSGTAALYYTTLNDRRSISFVNKPDGSVGEEVDLQSTKTFGVETSWDYRFVKDFSFYGSFTLQSHELTKSEANPDFEGNELRRQPKILYRLGLGYDNKVFDADFSYNYAGDKYTNDSNSVKLDGYGIANFNAGYTINTENNNDIRFGVQVFNLFNSDGITEGSPRLNNSQTEEAYFVGRPILPTRLFFNITFDF